MGTYNRRLPGPPSCDTSLSLRWSQREAEWNPSQMTKASPALPSQHPSPSPRPGLQVPPSCVDWKDWAELDVFFCMEPPMTQGRGLQWVARWKRREIIYRVSCTIIKQILIRVLTASIPRPQAPAGRLGDKRDADEGWKYLWIWRRPAKR